MRAQTRRDLLAGASAAAFVGALAIILASPPAAPERPSKTPPAHRINPVPHPRCFPPGTDGAAEFRLCPDGLIENNRSI